MGSHASVLDRIRGGLMVSCQAYPGEPMNVPSIMAAVAASVVAGGAVGVRAEGLADLHAVRAAVDVPLVGLEKIGTDGVFITPTLASALAVAATGCEIVAIDGTVRPRPNGRDLAATVSGIRAEHPDLLIMGDCATVDDARAAVAAGVDLVGTTLAGYTEHRPPTDGPDLDVLAEICAAVDVPVVAEGRYETPEHVVAAFDRGAFSVCVGSAITHPQRITARFVASL
ncbi:N-acetylmannosamine-6-phosphate 2-epimerase [Microlunatus sp. Y2014]|uniref:N-acetylmannosamine-6-phosphate 2-epimerase n=1 Tax=Microlunatus sp. Y2014 TaxID=3418488 RepID=UPI003DA729F7